MAACSSVPVTAGHRVDHVFYQRAFLQHSAKPCFTSLRHTRLDRLTVRAESSGGNGADPEPAPRPEITNSNGRRHHLPLSLFKRLGSLPFEGRTLTPSEESCDPYEELCKTPLHVWETRCGKCCGSGSVRCAASRGRGGKRAHGSLAICLICNGLGYVRHISADASAAEANPEYTLGREQPPESGTKPKTRIRMW